MTSRREGVSRVVDLVGLRAAGGRSPEEVAEWRLVVAEKLPAAYPDAGGLEGVWIRYDARKAEYAVVTRWGRLPGPITGFGETPGAAVSQVLRHLGDMAQPLPSPGHTAKQLTVGPPSSDVPLSASGFLEGLRCERALWLRTRCPEQLPASSAASRGWARSKAVVREVARELFPGGVFVSSGDVEEAAESTVEALSRGGPVYEGVLRGMSPFGPVAAKVDLLSSTGVSGWNLFSVKASTKILEEHVREVAFRRYVAERSGLRVVGCYVAHLNSTYVRNGALDPRALLKVAAVDREVDKITTEIEPSLRRLFEVLADDKPPEGCLGVRCREIRDCPFWDVCWGFLPERNVFGLHRGGKKAWRLYDSGVVDRLRIPGHVRLSPLQAIQVRAERTGARHVNREAVREFLDTLRYPLHFMDFEAFRTPVPPFQWLSPFSLVPFQFSVDVQDAPGAPLRHVSLLANIGVGGEDPRRRFLSALREALGPRGSIIAYGAAFERTVLRQAVTAHPVYHRWAEREVIPRLVDLLSLFRSFAYYHPAQDGSASLKKVLPALTGRGYEGMDIADGATAAAEYVRTHFFPVAPEEKARVRASLEKYCGLDTEGMAWIVDALRSLI